MAGHVENAKGIVAITRDGLITLILILLILMPATINRTLIDAGFVKGSIAGFEWQAVKDNVEDNNKKLSDATSTIETLQGQLTKTQQALQESENTRKALAEQVAVEAPETEAASMAASAPDPQTKEIVAQNNKILNNSEVRSNILRQQIRVNDRLLATVARPAGN
jgi:chromosome segregation ATPase